MAITAKSIVFDFLNSWGDPSLKMGVRRIEFFLGGSRITVTSGFSAYATTTDASVSPDYAFNTNGSKTGAQGGSSWISAYANSVYQRLIVVFTTPIVFDRIDIDNSHHYGFLVEVGVYNAKITVSTDSITDTTYSAAIANATLVYDGQFREHAGVNTADPQTLSLINVLTVSQNYFNLLWDIQPFYTSSQYTLLWSYSSPTEQHYNFLWSWQTETYYNFLYADKPQTSAYFNFFYWDAPVTTKAFNFLYNCGLVTNRFYDFKYTYAELAEKYTNFFYSFAGNEVMKKFDVLWNVYDFDRTETYNSFIYSLAGSTTFHARITASVSILGVSVPFNQISIEASKEAYYITGGFTISDPKFFYLCKVGNEILITVQGVVYSLWILTKPSKQIKLESVVYQVTCYSRAYLLGATATKTLQKEYPPMKCSEVAAELGAIVGVTVNWNIIHKNMLVDTQLAAGTLFANNEKPIDVLRKIVNACGGVIQSRPSGLLEIVHKYQVRIPDWQTTVPDYILSAEVRFRSLSSDTEEHSGYNTVTVSDQLASDKTWSIETKDVDSVTKELHGFNTPWDGADVELVTSGGYDISIEYLGVFEETYPPLTEDPETVEFVNGAATTSKNIYGIVERNWVRDDLGGITPSEDGHLTSEVLGESLMKLRYTIRYRKWRVVSPVLPEVQFILRPVDE